MFKMSVLELFLYLMLSMILGTFFGFGFVASTLPPECTKYLSHQQ